MGRCGRRHAGEAGAGSREIATGYRLGELVRHALRAGGVTAQLLAFTARQLYVAGTEIGVCHEAPGYEFGGEGMRLG